MLGFVVQGSLVWLNSPQHLLAEVTVCQGELPGFVIGQTAVWSLLEENLVFILTGFIVCPWHEVFRTVADHLNSEDCFSVKDIVYLRIFWMLISLGKR